jgi:TPR repeat protein
MPGLRDFLRKKDKIAKEAHTGTNLEVPEFRFIRSTTESEESIHPPSFPGDEQNGKSSREHRRHLGFRMSSASDVGETVMSEKDDDSNQLSPKGKGDRRLSSRLHLSRDRRSRSVSRESSVNLPDHLPDAPETIPAPARPDAVAIEGDKVATEQREEQWEKRATMLAMNNPLLDSQNEKRERSRSPGISDARGDVNIQEAIRLHEAGDLTASSNMFGQLADPRGANNALSQVLYGLALRHGWGLPIEHEKAIHYLSLAASNSASIEQEALASGMKKGGAAKGELVLAIFELANCFRHGWGVKKDAVAARQYYDTAANLGDTDAMEEAAWCYLEGFGGPKDKVRKRARVTWLCLSHCIVLVRSG